MAIKNFSSTEPKLKTSSLHLRIFSLGLLVFLLTSCVQKTVRHDQTKTTGKSSTSSSQTTTSTVQVEPAQTADPNVTVEPQAQPEPSRPVLKGPLPKFGFIFSGGGAKAWAHIGVLKELQKFKWPVHSVAGFEWGAVVAGVYASNLSANEVDWEMGKLKEFDDTKNFIKTSFEKRNTADFKVPFVCPSLNIAKQSYFMLNRGMLPDLMPFCVMHPPVTQPYMQSVAVLNDVTGLATHLRQTGANRIILVNVLGSASTPRSFVKDYESAENILWALSAASMAKKPAGVDEVITINLDDYGLKDFNKRRDIVAKGAELSYTQIQKLAQKYGL